MRYLMIWFCLLGLVAAVLAAPTLTNGVPVTVYLTFLPEFSNHGPVNAKGTATISIGEAWLELEATGLPHLKDDQYEVWITEAETGEQISLGKFNADTKGVVAYRADFDELPETEYRYLFISVEPVPDPDPAPDKRVTIAGVFPNARLLVVSGTPTPTPRPGVTPLPPPPDLLPVTGDHSVSATWLAAGGLFLMTVVLLVAALARRPGMPLPVVTRDERRIGLLHGEGTRLQSDEREG